LTMMFFFINLFWVFILIVIAPLWIFLLIIMLFMISLFWIFFCFIFKV
jgi:hypothetical protein